MIIPRIGFGYDVHPLASGRKLMLGGVEIPFSKGLDGHSDADVILHAICDALLGAANLRDIGFQFPNTDPQYHQADSKKLLKLVGEKIKELGYLVGNIDATLIAEEPKISPYIPMMQNQIADALEISISNVSIKATTNEKLGFIGKEEGMAAMAVALIYVRMD
jgi:2-C-methyl-D-erythritol 2,4-cyclodiphosphate synthase